MKRPDSLINLPVAEITEKWPETTALFLKYHMKCLGCSMDLFDTLGEALNYHHVSEAEFLAELHQLTSASTKKGNDDE